MKLSCSLLTVLSLLALTASSVLGAPPLNCPAPPANAAVSAASSTVATSSSVTTSSVASATTSSSAKGNGKGHNGNGKGHNDNGKGDNGKGDNGKKGDKKGAKSTAAVASASKVVVASSASAVASASSSSNKDISNAGGDKAAGASSSAALSTASPSSTGTATSVEDEQSATTLNPAVIATGFALDGQQTPAAGQVASLTSTNNFINFCLTVNKPLSEGLQIKTGTCNPAPMGVIAAITNMPSAKFTFPKNFGTIKANTEFTVTLAVSNLETGNLVNEAENYMSAPQQVNADGNIIGHSRIAIEQLDNLNQTTPTDPNKFAFFKGISAPAVNGVLSADIRQGLPAGVYRLSSFNSAANLQPVLVAVAQHGSLDDMVYFTVE